MKISYIYSVCTNYDAISNSISNEISWLLSEPNNEVKLFANRCEAPGIPAVEVSSISDIAFNQFFKESDVIVFHYGVFYELFNLIYICPKDAKTIVVFHNVTPPEFVRVEQRTLIEDSFKQMANIAHADHVFCDSDVNLRVLRDNRVTVPATVMKLAVDTGVDLALLDKPSFVDRRVRVCFVGRLVMSKGPLELLAAFEQVVSASSADFQLDIIGNIQFSDQEVIDNVHSGCQQLEARFGSRVSCAVRGSVSDDIKNTLLHDADLFVLPTYHEGFCVPILEALAAGCKVVSYDNSNVPAVCGGLASLVDTGDVDALSESIARQAKIVRSKMWQGHHTQGFAAYSERASNHVRAFRPDVVRPKFLAAVNDVLNDAQRVS